MVSQWFPHFNFVEKVWPTSVYVSVRNFFSGSLLPNAKRQLKESACAILPLNWTILKAPKPVGFLFQKFISWLLSVRLSTSSHKDTGRMCSIFCPLHKCLALLDSRNSYFLCCLKQNKKPQKQSVHKTQSRTKTTFTCPLPRASLSSISN